MYREGQPLFQNLPGHGMTTYGRVPEDRSIEVDDVSQLRTRSEETEDDEPGVVEGSKNGYYLEDRLEMQFHAEGLAKADYHRNGKYYRYLMDTLRKIHRKRHSWAKTEANIRLAMGNSSKWMNEPWIAPREYSSRPNRGVEGSLGDSNSDNMWQLVLRSIKQKRRSSDSLGKPTPRKRLKKQHRRLTSPGDLENNQSGPEGSEDEDTAPGYAISGEQRKKLVIRPPKPFEPGTRICAGCHQQWQMDQIFACHKCLRDVFCSIRCQQTLADTFCSDRCQEWHQASVNGERTVGLPPPPLHSPSAMVCSSGHLKSPPGSDISLSLARFRDSAGLPPTLTTENNTISAKTPICRELPAVRETCRLRREAATSIANREQLKHDIMHVEVVGFKIVDKGRKLQYEISDESNPETRWFYASQLEGEAWEEKLDKFWNENDYFDTTRRYLEDPEGDDPSEPGPFGRFIVRAEFVDHRYIAFEIRVFERLTPEEAADGKRWVMAVNLDEKWDEAIENYWRNCKSIQEWEEHKEHWMNEIWPLISVNREPEAGPSESK